MSSVSWQGSKDIDDLRSHHDSDHGREDKNMEDDTAFSDFDNDTDRVSLDGSAEAAITILHDETGPTPAKPLPFSNTEPTKQPSKPGDVLHRPMSQVVLSLDDLWVQIRSMINVSALWEVSSNESTKWLRYTAGAGRR
jgi:hypothetical protein